MPATTDYLPTREADLIQWSLNLHEKITATPTAYGLTAGQATAYGDLHSAFAEAWDAANKNTSRTPSAIGAKNVTKEALISGAGGIRELVSIVQSFPGTTRIERLDLQITVRDVDPTPIPQPSAAPALDIVERFSRTVRIRLHDASSPTSRGRPAGVQGATVFSWVGATPPADVTTWKSEGNHTRTVIDIEFPLTVAPATQVWLTASWYSPRGESGPACTPVSTNLDSAQRAAA